MQAGVAQQQLQGLHCIDVAITLMAEAPSQRGKHEDGVGVSQALKGGAYTRLPARQGEALGQGLGGDGLPLGTDPEAGRSGWINASSSQQRSSPLSDVPIRAVDDRHRYLE